MTSDSPIEVHHQEPRHTFEDPLLLVMVHSRPEEWYFRVSDEQAVAVCRLRFTGDPDNRPALQIHPDDAVAQDIVDAVLDYDGPYGPVTTVWNPTKPTPDDTAPSSDEV